MTREDYPLSAIRTRSRAMGQLAENMRDEAEQQRETALKMREHAQENASRSSSKVTRILDRRALAVSQELGTRDDA